MKGHFLVVNFLLLLLFQQTAEALNEDTLCGPRSLLMICEQHGVKTSIEELCKLSGYIDNTGTTMLGLSRAAKAKGLPVMAVRMNIKDLCGCDKHSIVYVDDTHFLVVKGCSEDSVLISNSQESFYSISKKKFQSIWEGEALIFTDSATKIASSDRGNTALSPKIVFALIKRDFGIVDEGEVLSQTFSFRNTGKGNLELTTRSSCGCTAAVLSEKSIPPGGKGKIFVEFNTQGKHSGKNIVQILVRSNDPTQKLTSLTLSATLRGKITVVPDKVWLGEMGANTEIKREVLLRDAGDGTSKVLQVTVPEGVKAMILPVRTDSTKLRIIPIQFSIRAGSQFGEMSKYAVIRTNSRKQPEIPVRIYGTVSSQVKVYPPRIYFGDVKVKTTLQREATITPSNGKKLDLDKISTSGPGFITKITPLDGKSYRMSVTLTAPNMEATMNDSIKIFLAGNTVPEMEIPVYARIVAK